MSIMKQAVLNSIALTGLALCAAGCFAQEDQGYWYAGGNFGITTLRVNASGIDDKLRALGATSAAATGSDDSDIGYKFFGGYRFNENVALELGWFALGAYHTQSLVSIGAASNTMNIEVKNNHGLNFDVVLGGPISGRISAFGRLGVIIAKSEALGSTSVAGTPINLSASESATNIKYGFGLEYLFDKRMSVRAEAERYRIPDGIEGRANVELYSLGLIIKF